MGIKDMFKKRDTLTEELRMLPRETKNRILEKVKRRKNEIMEERLLEYQLKNIKQPVSNEKTTSIREGMRKRREELREKGIIQPIVKYDRKSFRSPIEEMSRKARENEIKGFRDQRNRLKAGYNSEPKIKIKDLKLKIPKGTGILKNKKKSGLRDGII